MNNYFTSVQETAKLGEVFLFGLQKDFWYYESLYTQQPKYELARIADIQEFHNWLRRADQFELPTAFLVSSQMFQLQGSAYFSEVFQFAEQRRIPLILIQDHNLSIANERLRPLGFDDCVALPFSWSFLQHRISFLTQLKQKVNLYSYKHPSQPSIDISISLTKRLFDIVFASMAIIGLLPLFLVLGLAIKLESRGPIIYRSKRAGRGYQIFDFYKFRSMYNDADKRLNDLKHLNQYEDNGENCFIKIKNDPRITRIGKWIRKTSLDELPQLFNVLKGDMSIVGNRPLPLYEAKQLTKDHWAHRFLAPAGLTGLWQTTKRGKDTMSTQERVTLDIEYAESHNFWYDCRILLKTIPAMIQEEDV